MIFRLVCSVLVVFIVCRIEIRFCGLVLIVLMVLIMFVRLVLFFMLMRLLFCCLILMFECVVVIVCFCENGVGWFIIGFVLMVIDRLLCVIV